MSSGYQDGQSVINPAPNVDNVRHSFVSAFPEISGTQQVEMLAGDGSTRSYYRVHGKNRTYVLQTNGSDELNYRRFLQANEFYLQMGIPVPKVLAHDDSRLWVLIEDLGSEDLQASATFQTLLNSVKLLKFLAPAKVENSFAKTWLAERTLDEARFAFEMNHFVEHFVEKLLGETAEENLKKELYTLAAKSSRGPVVFCHRDYQSRNLMKRGDAYVMIDFQDSQWGPALYDAVSLCWDPYFVLSESDREKLFASYLECLDAKVVNDDFAKLLGDKKQIEEQKLLLIVERFVKAIGSFASFKTVRGKDTHLVYVEDSFKTVLHALEQLEKSGIKFPLLKAKSQNWLKVAQTKGWGR